MSETKCKEHTDTRIGYLSISYWISSILDFNYLLFSPLLAEYSHFDSYFSDGLKPPTRHVSMFHTCFVSALEEKSHFIAIFAGLLKYFVLDFFSCHIWIVFPLFLWLLLSRHNIHPVWFFWSEEKFDAPWPRMGVCVLCCFVCSRFAICWGGTFGPKKITPWFATIVITIKPPFGLKIVSNHPSKSKKSDMVIYGVFGEDTSFGLEATEKTHASLSGILILHRNTNLLVDGDAW